MGADWGPLPGLRGGVGPRQSDPVAWIVPRKNRNVLLISGPVSGYRERLLAPEEAGPVPVPLGAPHAHDSERDRLVYAEGGRLFVVEGLVSGKAETRSLRVSWVSTITALMLHGDLVYVGGRAPFGLLLGLVSLRGKLAWTPIEIPAEAHGSPGKGIDGFALHEGRLIVVDDVVFPWYFLIYDLSHPASPRPVGLRMFHGHVSSMAYGHGLLALRQLRQNRWQLRRVTRLYDLATLDERCTLEGPEGASEWGDVPGIPGVAFAEGKLLLAHGEQGLGVLDLSTLEGARSPSPGSVVAVSESGVHAVPVPEGAVVGVIPMDTGLVFAVVRGRWGLDSVLVRYLSPGVRGDAAAVDVPRRFTPWWGTAGSRGRSLPLGGLGLGFVLRGLGLRVDGGRVGLVGQRAGADPEARLVLRVGVGDQRR